MQDGRDGDEEPGYIGNIKNNATAGFKYFDFKNVKKLTIVTRAYIHGDFEVRTEWNGPLLGKISLTDGSNFWEKHSAEIAFPEGCHALYLKFTGSGTGQLKSIIFE